ncbi:IS30 family transposase [Salinicola sp. LHM]|uniref:IS30 family transposase n=1 Tax=Salinicola sp. LHM TaxID=3065298 RepID=UPI002ACE5DA4|nr:IS30 family transposase [Salinicola sp. LHM]WQH33691.1 IS30 family transposase [Salinicola sp. LHM]
MTYRHLTAEDRAAIMMMRATHSIRAIASHLGRAPSTVSRELTRHTVSVAAGYDASLAGYRARLARHRTRRCPKLHPDGELFELVAYLLRKYWSPQQIARTLKGMFPDDTQRQASHEAIYNALYVMPRGSLKKELIACLRQGNGKRRPRSRGKDRRGQIPDLVSIHLRPPEIEDRLMPGHWEGDLIMGANNRSAVGTLVERTTRLVLLAKLDGTTATAAAIGFSDKLNEVPRSLRLSMTYDQGREMVKHAEITQRTGTAIYFADPHSPWQRGSNENTNGLLRQYLPKGTDLSVYSQEELDAIADSLNTRPRQTLDWRTPLEVYADVLKKSIAGPDTLQ